ncbi:MAG: hypothetical protein AAF846_23700 [Chloroflexota bacterium]
MHKAKNDFYKAKNDHVPDYRVGAGFLTFIILAFPVSLFTYITVIKDVLCIGPDNFWLLVWTVIIMTPFVLYWIPKIILKRLTAPTMFKVASLSIIASAMLYAIPISMFWYLPCSW